MVCIRIGPKLSIIWFPLRIPNMGEQRFLFIFYFYFFFASDNFFFFFSFFFVKLCISSGQLNGAGPPNNVQDYVKLGAQTMAVFNIVCPKAPRHKRFLIVTPRDQALTRTQWQCLLSYQNSHCNIRLMLSFMANTKTNSRHKKNENVWLLV